MTTKSKVVMLIPPFGFGPVGKALAISQILKDQGFEIEIYTDSIAKSLLNDSGYRVKLYDYGLEFDAAAVKANIIVLVGDVVTPIKGKVPVILIDSLLWLRGKYEKLWDIKCDYYISQKFFVPISQKVIDNIGNRLIEVSPILPDWVFSNKTIKAPKLVLMSVGGMRSPVMDLNSQIVYLNWLNKIIVTVDKNLLENLLLVLPSHLYHLEQTKTLRQKIRVEKGQSKTLKDNLPMVKHAIVAPGIETMLELTASNTSIHWLPPFNGSHIAQLKAYRVAKVGNSLSNFFEPHFRDLEDFWNSSLRELSIEVARRNAKLMLNDSIIKSTRENLIQILASNSNSETINRNTQALKSLGVNGAQSVANVIANLS